ncbi:VOC family protein [Nocardioides pacificus]
MSPAPTPGDSVALSAQDVLAEELTDWRQLLHALHTRLRTGDHRTGARLVARIAEAADEMDHHPDLDLRYDHLDVRLASHDVRAVTLRDIRLARRISDIAAQEGVAAEPHAVQVLEVALDTPDYRLLKPFWRAVLGLSDHPTYDAELGDQGGPLPALWFQEAPGAASEPGAQRFHLDVHVPHDLAEERVSAALAAGGTMVSEAEAPSFWVLADAEGNKACVCTCLEADTGSGTES